MKNENIVRVDAPELLMAFATATKESQLDNREAVSVGVGMLMWWPCELATINSGEDLERFVIELAKDDGKNNAFGLDYVPEAFLDSDDDAFVSTDEGDLSWVPFSDLYEVLVKTEEKLQANG